MKITPKSWAEFQHYKDRNPPWIRLHKSLIDNYEFQCLPVASRALAPMLWLLASESPDASIDADPKKLAFRLRQPDKELSAALKPLIDNGFFIVIQNASSALAEGEQHAVPETETETETETEAEAENRGRSRGRKPSAGVADAPPTAPTAAVWDSYSKAYAKRYGASPVRNATVNGQLSHFVGRIGAEEAPDVAAFYVGHQNGLYVNAMHPVNLLLRDAEKLRTECVTRRQVTRTQANLADKTQTNLNAFAPLIAEAKAREQGGDHAKLGAA